jgi:hypothetical protein
LSDQFLEKFAPTNVFLTNVPCFFPLEWMAAHKSGSDPYTGPSVYHNGVRHKECCVGHSKSDWWKAPLQEAEARARERKAATEKRKAKAKAAVAAATATSKK